MSAAEFVQQLFGELPALFKDEDELRELWSRPDTRRQLLDGLAEKGCGKQQLAEVARVVDAERSDLYDVLAYIAFSLAPISREERVDGRREVILAEYDYKQREFLEFVLEQYIRQGVGELDDSKLPQLIRLKYQTTTDAVAELGDVNLIKDVFVGFQRHLYDELPGG